MARPLSALRIASTAAWSAAFSSPRPISLEAASAAASVTRTASRARLRSIVPFDMACLPLLLFVAVEPLERFDAYHMGRLEHGTELGNALQRATHGSLLGLMRGEDDRHRLAGGPRA